METSPVRPLHNIYFQQLLPLIDLKLRIGRALTTQTALSAQERGSSVISAEWQTAVRELDLGLELARTAACQRKPVEAQLLLTLGECVPILKGAQLRFVQLENLNTKRRYQSVLRDSAHQSKTPMRRFHWSEINGLTLSVQF